MVKKQTLFLIAAIVWCIAGFNVTKIGFECYPPYITVINIALSLVVFFLFDRFVFSKLVVKHNKRIHAFEEEKHIFYKFFDLKSFCIMAFMISFGIIIRTQHLLNDQSIAIFYSGLGCSLFLAGIRFGVIYLKGE